MKKLAIYGASAPDVVRLVDIINKHSPTWCDLAFLDDVKYPRESHFKGIPIVGNKNHIEELKTKDYLFINNVASSISAINKINSLLIQQNVFFANLIAPNTILDNVTIGKGIMIYPNVYLGCEVVLGDYCMVRANTSINNNVVVGDSCFFSAGVHIGGRCVIKSNCYFGIGSLVRDNLLINENCTIGMGSVVVRNIDKNSLVYGNPAKKRETI